MEFPAQTLALSRRKLIAGGLALGAAPLLPKFLGMANAAPRAFGYPEPDMTSRIVRPIEFPVEGAVNWTDTYGACRDGCSRRHEGQDLLGRKLQRLVACVDGTVVALKYQTSGNYLYLQDADGWNYGYLHINNDTPGTDDGANPRAWAFAPGIVLGAKVRKGQFIAYMGDSGNAEGTVPHCHYEIRKPADAWYHGQAINAVYSLRAASHGGISGVPPSTFTPWSTPAGFINQQYVDFLARRPRPAEVAMWTAALDSGDQTPADLVEWLLSQPGSDDVIAPLLRLYLAAFDRLPDTTGLMYWISRVRGTSTLDEVAYTFSVSAEFRHRYDALDDGQFVDAIYLKMLGRAADRSGRAYWVHRLGSGTSRGRMLRYFAETEYVRFVTHQPVRVGLVYAGMLHRAPDTSGFRYWIDKTNAGMPLQTMITTIQRSTTYGRRFPTPSVRSFAAPPPAVPFTSDPTTSPPAPPQTAPTAPPLTAAPTTTRVPRTTTTRVPRTTTTRVPRTTTTLPRTTTTTTIAPTTSTTIPAGVPPTTVP